MGISVTFPALSAELQQIHKWDKVLYQPPPRLAVMLFKGGHVNLSSKLESPLGMKYMLLVRSNLKNKKNYKKPM